MGKTPNRAALEKPFIPPLDKRLVRYTQELFSSSYILGMDHASSTMTAADDPPALTFKEAVSAIRSRVSLSKAEWKQLEPKLRFRAFTVAKLSTVDAIERVRKSMISSVEKGMPFEEFWTKSSAEASAGISVASPWYWETVFRTNIQTTYNTGRAAEFMRTQPEYLEFVGIEDERQTEICRVRSGVIRPATDPWWKSNWPPLHFSCRSTVRGVWREEVDLMREENPDWKPTGQDELVSMGRADRGFGGNPLDTGSFYKLTEQMIGRVKEYGIEDELRAFAKQLGLDYDPVKVSELRISEAIVKATTSIIPPATREGFRSLEKKLMRFGSISSPAVGEEIVIGRTGIEKALSFAASPEKRKALSDLPKLISKITDVTRAPSIRYGFSESITGRVAYQYGEKTIQFELILLRRTFDGKLGFYDLVPYILK